MKPLHPSLACVLLALAACSSEQLYQTGRGAQRAECNKLQDAQQRERCFKDADTSYDAYKRETEDLKK